MIKYVALAFVVGTLFGFVLAPSNPASEYVQVDTTNSYSEYVLCGIDVKDYVILTGKNFGASCGEYITITVGDSMITGEIAGILDEPNARIEVHNLQTQEVISFDRSSY